METKKASKTCFWQQEAIPLMLVKVDSELVWSVILTNVIFNYEYLIRTEKLRLLTTIFVNTSLLQLLVAIAKFSVLCLKMFRVARAGNFHWFASSSNDFGCHNKGFWYFASKGLSCMHFQRDVKDKEQASTVHKANIYR